MDVGEAGEGAVGGEIVGGDDDSRAELEGDDRSSGDDGRLRVCDGLLCSAVRLGEVSGIVAAVDIIARLCPSVWVMTIIMVVMGELTLPQTSGRWFIVVGIAVVRIDVCGISRSMVEEQKSRAVGRDVRCF